MLKSMSQRAKGGGREGRGCDGSTTRHTEVKQSQQNNAYISTSSYAPSPLSFCMSCCHEPFILLLVLFAALLSRPPPPSPLPWAHFTQTRRKLITFYDANDAKLHTKSHNY